MLRVREKIVLRVAPEIISQDTKIQRLRSQFMGARAPWPLHLPNCKTSLEWFKATGYFIDGLIFFS